MGLTVGLAGEAWAGPRTTAKYADAADAAWAATVGHQPDAAERASGLLETTLVPEEGSSSELRVSDPAGELLRVRLASGDASAREPLAVHLRTLAQEAAGLAALEQDRGSLLGAVEPARLRPSLGPAGLALPEAVRGVGTRATEGSVVASQELRALSAVRWGSERRRAGWTSEEALVLVGAIAALVTLIGGWLATGAPVAIPASGNRHRPPMPRFPNTPEGLLRRRFAALVSRLHPATGEPCRLTNAELEHRLEGMERRAFARARAAHEPVAYGGEAATSERQRVVAEAEALIG